MRDVLFRAASDAGCVGFGVCAADPFSSEIGAVRERKAAGMSGRLGFTFADPELAGTPTSSFPWARSLVVVAHPYLPEAGSPGPATTTTARIARFAESDHYSGLGAALDAISSILTHGGYRAEAMADDSRLLDRAAAVRAGVGWWGKNTMVLVPPVGPWVLLGTVVTDAYLPRDRPLARDCGKCSACLPACPTGALVAPGVLDARRCLAAWLQSPGVIPVDIRPAVGDRLYGCDDCLDACPPGTKVLRLAVSRRGRVDALELLAMDDATLLDAFGRFYVPGRRPRYLRRNALVVLGNSGVPEALAPVVGYLGHPDWLLRAHAAWAAGRLGGSIARASLRSAASGETDGRVGSEITAAMVPVA